MLERTSSERPEPPHDGIRKHMGDELGMRVSRGVATAIVALIVIGCLIGYIWDRNGGSLDFSDTQVLIVISGSMDGEPREQYEIETIPIESMVFVHEVPSDPSAAQEFYASLEVGDVLTFDYRHPVTGEHMVVTHRIISVSESGGVYTYTMAGDSIADDPTNTSTQTVTSQSGDVIGEVVGVSHWLGVLTVFLSHWYGKALLIVVPCLILAVSELSSIARNIRTLRKEREGEATDE